jgi:hypothetical protein
MLGNTISILQSNKFYGAGEFTELAKGKNELVSDWRGFKRKVKRIWLSRNK